MRDDCDDGIVSDAGRLRMTMATAVIVVLPVVMLQSMVLKTQMKRMVITPRIGSANDEADKVEDTAVMIRLKSSESSMTTMMKAMMTLTAPPVMMQ